MGQRTNIAWCHSTFNPWRGCTKVSPGCANCYAEKLSQRNPAVLGEWGPNGKRVVASESYWAQPQKWDREAARAGERHRVFCASLADVFEDRAELIAPRVRLFHLISETPNLDWLLLTKRPENIQKFCSDPDTKRSWSWSMPPNVWLGTSVENQATADERIPHLLRVPAAVRFLSVEPLLSAIDLRKGIYFHGGHKVMAWGNRGTTLDGIHWVIVGGESGPGARPCNIDWIRSVVEQCRAAEIPAFVKQVGSHVVARNDDVADWFGECGHLDLSPTEKFQGATGRVRGLHDRKGGDSAEWPADLRVRQFPTALTGATR